jgi:Cof subfamily protein (haloacid dehalogenase superfamily)
MAKTTKIHLVAIDLDGTLLNSAKQITETTAAILRAARRQAGVHVVLASARPPRSVMPFYTLLDLDSPMINYNGALVYDPPSRRILMHRPISVKVAREIITIARMLYPEVLVSAEVLDRWYTDRVDVVYLKDNTTETARTFRPDLVAPVDEWLTEELTKVLLLGDPGRLKGIAAAVRERFLHQLSILQTDEYLLQIMHATVSKAQALKVVAGELSVPREQVMAIGDNANDVGMLQWAGVGVAMGNATPEVLAVADYVTGHHDADGAAKAIRRIILEGLPGR